MNFILLRLFLLFSSFLMFGFTSCGDKSGDAADPIATTKPQPQIPLQLKLKAPFPMLTRKRKLYNSEPSLILGMYTTICPEELNGEVLNDAVYLRNQRLEQALNCKIIDTRTGTEGDYGNNLDSNNQLGKICACRRRLYDVMYLSPQRSQ